MPKFKFLGTPEQIHDDKSVKLSGKLVGKHFGAREFIQPGTTITVTDQEAADFANHDEFEEVTDAAPAPPAPTAPPEGSKAPSKPAK